MGQREYVISIEGDEQYRTENRARAKVFYNMVDETFERDVDGRKKQLIQIESNGWDSKVLLEDIIHCPKEELDESEQEEQEEEQPIRRGFHR